MTINAPTPQQIPRLKALWHQAFGDDDAFIDGFFANAFSFERCRCVTLDGQVAAALYWFPCGKFAYIYAVATLERHRGQGLCPALMQDTHRHLAENGYDGAVLVPAEPGLWGYYGKMGYVPFGKSRSFEATAGDPIPLKELTEAEYAALRERYLPAGALTETACLAYYGTWGKFYRGENCLFAAAIHNDTLYIQEFFGDPAAAPGIVATLGVTCGKFRIPEGDDPCGMYLPFAETPPPTYLGFPLD